jgi:hypothetical protein
MGIFACRTNGKPFAAAVAFGLVAAVAAACGPGDGDGGPGPAGGQPTAAAPTDQSIVPNLSVTAPAEGEAVTVPFEVSVDSSVELGTIDEQLHHLHIWFGDTSGQPLIVESDTTTVEDAPDGETTMIVQVHTFDHQPASEQVSVPLTVQGGSDGGGPPGNDY